MAGWRANLKIARSPRETRLAYALLVLTTSMDTKRRACFNRTIRTSPSRVANANLLRVGDLLARTMVRAIIRARSATTIITSHTRITLANSMPELIMHAHSRARTIVFARFKSTIFASPAISAVTSTVNTTSMRGVAFHITDSSIRAAIVCFVTSTSRPSLLANAVTKSATTMNAGHGARGH